MQFLYPLFLGALAALAIPVIIHLFYFRRYKKVMFTNVRFLKEVKEESSIRSRLKNLLTLLCRLLAILFLVLGFAQPFIKQSAEVKKGQKLVSIFVDNSYSMASLSQDAPLLDEAKRKAEEIINAYDLEDQFQIISHDMSARQQRLLGKEQALALIDDIELTPEVNSLSQVLVRQQQILESDPNPNKIIYYISDFQENIVDFDLTDTLFEYNLIPLRAVVEQNVSIDSAWFEAPVQMMNRPNRLFVKIRNWSNQSAENVQLTIRQDGEVKPIGSLDIGPSTSVIDTVLVSVLTPGYQRVELKITDFPVQFDDTYYLSFEVRQQINTLIVNQDSPNRFVTAAFASRQHFESTNRNADNLDYTEFNQYNLILLNELRSVTTGLASALASYIDEGGNVLIFPAQDADLSGYNAFLSQIRAGQISSWDTTTSTVNYVNTNEFIFGDVFESTRRNLRLPTTQGHFRIMSQNTGSERLLGYRDGRVFLSKYRRGKGHVYLCASPLNVDVNNLVTQAEVFIPMLYKMALSTSAAPQIAYTIGADNIIEIENTASGSEVVYKVKGETSFIPGQQTIGKRVMLHMYDQIEKAGFYDVFLREEQPLRTIAFNSNRLESNPVCLNESQISGRYADFANIVSDTQLADLSQYIQDKDRGIILWKYCLILALLFLALETLIIRFWSV